MATKTALDKLREVVESRGRAAVLQDTGLSKQYLSNLLGGNKPFGLNARNRFEEALGLPSGYFTVDTAPEGGARQAGTLPVIAWADVGRISLDDATQRVVFDTNRCSAGSFMVLIDGEAMVSPAATERSLLPGTYVAIDPEASAKPGDFVLARHPGAELPVVRKLISDSGQLYLVALNPRFNELVKVTPQVEILGRAVGVVAML